ncbi:hypothetical protein ACJJTC_004132 [Scirpophaga incertulas]
MSRTAGVLQIAAVDGATASRCDVRPLALKTKLLDNVRSYGYLFPTGVTWSVPLKTNIPFENSARDVVDNWNYQAIAVTPQVLDVYVREGAVCSLPVGVVNALPYPLLARTEWFALNDNENPDDIKIASFLRNEGLVTICNQVSKIILLVSAPQKRVRIGGADIPVVGVARNEEVPPLMPIDARDLIVGCLDSLMSHPVSLTELFNRWAVARVSSQSVDWAEIDTYVSVLTNRFVRQEEVDVRAGGDRRTVWLPPAFRSSRFGTHTLPPARHFEGEEEFDAGLGWATADQPSYNKASGRNGDSLPIDNVERAVLIRRAFEEYKAAACCADEILAPNSVGNLGPFWSVLVTDTGSGEGDTAEEVGYDLINSAPAETGLSWLVNTFEVPAIGLTGKRTPSGLWLSEHCSGISTFKLSGMEEFTQLTGMGDWWMNDYFVQPISQQVDAPQVERGLMRLDLLDVAERDISVYSTPILYILIFRRIKSKVKLGGSQDVRAQSIREVEDIMSVVEDVVRETTSVGDTETGGHRDGLPQLVGWTEGKYWLGDCGVLQIAAVDGATASRCDVRPLALKTKLLDNVRSYGYLFPTGVTWSVPLKTNIPFENSARDVVDNWNYQAIAVTPQGLTPVLWALQVVNALPYPLLARTEWFALNDNENPDDIKIASFLRNEGLVTICNQVSKIILLVSAPQKRVRIGGADIPVVGVARNEEVPPLMPIDARDLIVGCLDSLMSHPVSLTELFNRWAVARVSSQSVDWAEIDTYVSVLTNRFVRQEEVDVRAGGDRRTVWLPPAFRSSRFGTHTLPPARHFEGEEEFDAGNAATPLDQIVTDRATGLGWATADQPSYNKASGRNGDSLPIDNVERAVLIRRAFEEYKAAACCADEILAPNSVGNLGPFWSVLVTDTGSGEGDTAEEVGYDLINSAPAETGLSWLVNTFEVPAIGLTGKRTPSGLWLSEHCSGISTFKLSGMEEYTQLTGMGDWWMNDYFVQPISQQVDAPQVERGLMRLDLLDVAERDISVYSTPILYILIFRRIKSKVKLGGSQDVRAQSIREVEDIMSVVEDVVRETTSVGDTETGGHRDGLPQLVGWTEGKYWLGVGNDRKFNVASLTPTAEAATLLAKEQGTPGREMAD